LLILHEEPPGHPAERRAQQRHDGRETESELTRSAEPLEHDGAPHHRRSWKRSRSEVGRCSVRKRSGRRGVMPRAGR
jgi:hypothetical protein